MSTAKSDTISTRISKTLADRIISGAIEAGARLRQDHVAEEFGASHVPVREAFRLLESQGLVVSEPRRGVRVAGFTLEEVREVAEMRAALEALALALPAYPRANGAALGEAVFAAQGVAPLRDEDLRPFSGLASLAERLKSGQKDAE